MAWIETRGRRSPVYRVCWRENGVVERESFDDAADAALYRTLVERAGGTRPPAAPETAADGSPSPVPVAGRPCTFAAWASYWASGLSGLRPRTAAGYRRTVERDFLPVFGDLDITAIDRTMIGGWVAALEEEDLSPKTIRNKHGLLFQIFEAATSHEPRPMRSRNPCRGTRLPTVWKAPIRPLSSVEFHRLLAAVGEPYRPLVELLVATGLRWGEVTGLRVRDIDVLGTGPIGAHLAIEWTLQRGADGEYRLGRPKSRAAQRVVPLSPRAVDLLLPLLVTKEPADLVFTTPFGGAIRHQNFYTRIWRPAVLRAGLGEAGPVPALRIHDLRHTYVAWLLHASPTTGTSYKISRWLGHESYAFTADRYGYLLPQEARQEMAAIDLALAPPPDTSPARTAAPVS
jgi:integrase